ncbi:hypothetical protein MBO12_05130 [Candidatus Saccharibacteria bacterium]|nr:hypothetical protein [Candidatus Saccharibacteria bacterium]
MNREKFKSSNLPERQTLSNDTSSTPSGTTEQLRSPVLGYYPAEEQAMLEKGMVQLTDRPIVHQALRQALARRDNRSGKEPAGGNNSNEIGSTIAETGVSGDSDR